jgi:3-deoxy-D-manno-octulosonate 8-phosphate phosphatase (KDO 8-P phosphatase)
MCTIDYAAIRLLVLDVDGVLTDGRIILTPDGQEIKAFHVRDGAGMKYWKREGGKLAVITGRGSPTVLRRAEELGVDAVRLEARDKLPAYESVLAELGLTPQQTAVMGDDLPDLPLMRRCALPVAVADAVEEVKRAAGYVTRLSGGAGAVREVIEVILRQTGAWDAVMARYIPPKAERPG